MNLKAIWTLFKAKDEIETVVKDIKDVPKFYKTLGFWLTLVGNLLALVTALTGLLPAAPAIIAGTSITVLYAVLRAVEKSKATGTRDWWKTSEFYMSVLAALSAGVVSLQTGGINPEWLAPLGTFLAAVLAATQQKANSQPANPTDTPQQS